MEANRRVSAWRRAAFAGLLALLGALSLAGSSLLPGSSDAGAISNAGFRDVRIRIAVPQYGQWYIVEVQFLMQDDGSADFEARAATAREDMLGRFPGAVDLGDAGEVQASFVNQGYWWPSKTASWSYNPAGKPNALTGDQAAISAAAATWSSAGVGFSFNGGGSSGAGTGACNGGGLDGSNTIGWAPQSGSVLAVTCTWYSNTGIPKPATEFDMEIDPGWNWTTGTSITIDVQSVVLHEFGHALGLGHSADASAVMYANYCSGCNKRALAADDIAGAASIYGGSGTVPTATPPPPTATATATPTGTPTPTAPPPTATPTAPPPTATPTVPPPTATPSVPPPTDTPTATRTPVPPPSPSPTATATATASPTSAASPTSTAGTPPAAGASASPSPSPSPSRTVTTSPPPPRTLPLLPGANLLAWPGSSQPAAQAAGRPALLLVIYNWNPVTQTWSRYVPGAPAFVNTLFTLEQGQVYWFIAASVGALPLGR